MTLFELMAKISLDTSEYDSGLSGASGKLQTFGNSMKSGFGKIMKAGGVALAGATTAITAFGAKSVKTGMDFDKSMSQVAATMGKTTDEIQDLRDFAQEMGSTTSFSAKQAADALNYMALAGYDSEKSMKMLPNVLNLAAAGGMELATASDMVTDASSALGLSMEETEAMVDQMARASSKSNTSVEQLGQAMLTVGGTAKSLKGGTTELATALGILADNGTKGAEGGTALRNILSTIQGSKFEKTFGEMGISAYDAQGNLRSLKDVFMDMNTAMDGMTTEEKTNLINNTFNARDLKNVNALLGTNAKRWDELTASIGDSSGAAKEMADTQLDNLAGDITLFKSALEGAQIAISDNLSPSLRDFVKAGSTGLSEFTDKLKSEGLSSAIESLGGTIANLATIALSKVPDLIMAGGQLLLGIGKGFVQNIPSLIKSFTVAVPNILGAIRDMFSGMDFSSSFASIGEALAEAFDSLKGYLPMLLDAFANIDFGSIATNLLSGFLTVFATLSTQVLPVITEFIQNISTGFVQGIPQFLSNVLPMILKFTEYIRANAGQLVDAGLTFIKNLAQGIINSIPLLVSYVPQIITNLAGVINDNAPKVLSTGVTIIKNLVMGIVKAIPVIVANIPQIIQAIVSVISAFNWLNLGKQIITAFKNGILALRGAVSGAGKNIFNAVVNAIKSLPSKLLGLAKTGISSFKGALAGGAGLLKAAAKTILQGIVSALTSLPSKLIALALKAVNSMKSKFTSVDWGSVGTNIINGIVRGIGGAAGALFGKLRSLASDALSAAKKALGINSPSKLFRDVIGKGITEGWALGIEKGSVDVRKAMDNLDDMVTSDIPSIPDLTLEPMANTMTPSSDSPYATIEVPEGTDGIRGVKNVNVYNYITVDGAKDPEEYTEQLVRSIRQQVRMA